MAPIDFCGDSLYLSMAPISYGGIQVVFFVRFLIPKLGHTPLDAIL